MKPSVQVLSSEEEKKIIQEAIKLLENPGVIVSNSEALNLLSDAGAKVNLNSKVSSIPEDLIHNALKNCPAEFSLFNLKGDTAVQYGSDRTFFNPGSSTLYILDSQTQKTRKVITNDLVQFIQLVESLPPIDAQSTAMVPSDVPEAIQDLYRLYLALCYMTKPIITGIFRKESWDVMKELLVTAAGGEQALQEKPLGAGATSPVTLAGTVIQHAAECLSGIVIAQLACKGAKIVWGGSAAVFDMKHSTAPMGAPGTWLPRNLVNCSCLYADWQVAGTSNSSLPGYFRCKNCRFSVRNGIGNRVAARFPGWGKYDLRCWNAGLRELPKSRKVNSGFRNDRFHQTFLNRNPISRKSPGHQPHPGNRNHR